MKKETMMKTLKEAISNVLDTMFFQPVQLDESNSNFQEWFSIGQSLCGATVSFNGPLAGSLYLIVPLDLLSEITANFLGLKEEEIHEDQRRDTVREALNMIGGRMLSLADKAGAFKLGIPELMDENDLSDEKLAALRGDMVFIGTENNHLAAGIMIETGNLKLET
ncbi:MAG: chemotaxis protein CheX [Deltaproteobacteria bacterium]|nr:chemotaxis protein CheX [Deltaproteobacteria bacterium]